MQLCKKYNFKGGACNNPAPYIDYRSGDHVCEKHLPKPKYICTRCGATSIKANKNDACLYCPSGKMIPLSNAWTPPRTASSF